MAKKKSKVKKTRKAGSLELKNEREIAMDFAVKTYRKFDKIIKAIILFGSASPQKGNSISTSDIDIVILIDDAAIQWDQELISWYREELGKIVQENPYAKELHINTVKTTTWWDDLMKGDPVVINILRYGEALIDIGGFFNPLKALLIQGKIRPTPEAIYTTLQRAPEHLRRAKITKVSTIEGLYWAVLDSSQAALMAAKQSPPSPEHIPGMLKEVFVDTGNLKSDYIEIFRGLYILHKKVFHGELIDIPGKEIDEWEIRADDFVRTMVSLVKKSLG